MYTKKCIALNQIRESESSNIVNDNDRKKRCANQRGPFSFQLHVFVVVDCVRAQYPATYFY